MSRPVNPRQEQAERRLGRIMIAIVVVIGGFLVYATVDTVATSRQPSAFDPSLPNPMGGPAKGGPAGSGLVDLAGLVIDGAEVELGDVALGVTYVPAWLVTNPTDVDLSVAVGQPQVLQGCCPGPVYADGELTRTGESLTVPAGGSVQLQFPLQMHPGMDGPHHLTLPLAAAGETATVHVTGNFTASAPAA